MLDGVRTFGRLTALSLAAAILYGLVVSPLFVFCVGASGHREIETTTCAGCVHPPESGPADPADHASAALGFRPVETCGDCTDFNLMLSATDRSDPDEASASLAPAACPCPPERPTVPDRLATAADSSWLQDSTRPISALPQSLRI